MRTQALTRLAASAYDHNIQKRCHSHYMDFTHSSALHLVMDNNTDPNSPCASFAQYSSDIAQHFEKLNPDYTNHILVNTYSFSTLFAMFGPSFSINLPTNQNQPTCNCSHLVFTVRAHDASQIALTPEIATHILKAIQYDQLKSI